MATKSDRSHLNHLQFESVAIDSLRIPERDLRKHPTRQIEKLAKSIDRFGFVAPILIDARGEVIAGLARIAAAKRLGVLQAPAIRVEHLSPEEVRAYRIADNRLAEDADWNDEALRIEVRELIELDFDIEALGFEVPEIDIMLDVTEPQAEEEIPSLLSVPVTRPGDVWVLGLHRLICGDALAPDTYSALLGDQLADMVFTDPPYNVPIDRHVSGLGKIRHREFAMASGEMSTEAFSSFLETSHAQLLKHLKAGGIAFSCMDWRSVSTLMGASQSAGFDLINLAVWDKGVGGMGALYRSQHELVCVLKKPGAAHRNNVELGKYGRNRTNIWTYPGYNAGSRDRDKALSLHPTVKPVGLITDAIKDVTARGEIILDAFAGSGSTLLAAEETGRVARLIELDPIYCDVIIKRVTETLNLEATLEASGQSFKAIRDERGSDHD